MQIPIYRTGFDKVKSKREQVKGINWRLKNLYLTVPQT